MQARALLVILSLILVTAVSRAEEPSFLQRLAAESDVVMLGRCLETRSEWDAGRRIITTRATVKPMSMMKGSANSEVVVRVLGGTVDGVSMGASHGATMARGEEAVLFLRRSGRGDHYVVHGGTEGKLLVDPSQPDRVRTASGRVVRLSDVAAAASGGSRQ